MSLAERAADLGYAAGWRAVRLLPDRVARAAFAAGADLVSARGGPDQLRKNLARVLDTTPAQVPDSLMREAMRSYARYWCEAFRLPTMDLAQVAETVFLEPAQIEMFERAYDRGRGLVFALPHSGNWDMAGVWLIQHTGRSFATVAERLKPDSLFERFVAYRESLGFEIFPLTGGEQPPFEQLADRLRQGKVVCLLAERDLTSHGVPVQFFGEKTRMPAGPALLAQQTGAALIPVHHFFHEGRRSQIVCCDEIDVSVGVEAATQKLADVFAENIAAHPQDWHMLQPLWADDWSARRRAQIEGGNHRS